VWRITTAIKAAKARVKHSTTRILNLEHSTRLGVTVNESKRSILFKPCHGSRPRL